MYAPGFGLARHPEICLFFSRVGLEGVRFGAQLIPTLIDRSLGLCRSSEKMWETKQIRPVITQVYVTFTELLT